MRFHNSAHSASPTQAVSEEDVQTDPGVPEMAEAAVVPRLLSLLGSTPQILPTRRDLIQILGGWLPPETIQTINLTAWPLTSSRAEQLAFHRKLQPWLERQGDCRPEELMIRNCDLTEHGASGTMLIHCERL